VKYETIEPTFLDLRKYNLLRQASKIIDGSGSELIVKLYKESASADAIDKRTDLACAMRIRVIRIGDGRYDSNEYVNLGHAFVDMSLGKASTNLAYLEWIDFV